MATDQQRKAALGVLAEIVPANVLGRAHELAREIQREEYVRSYLAKRAAGIVALGLVAMIVSTVATRFLLEYAFQELGPVATWIRLLIGAFGVVLWLSGILVPLFYCLSRLQRQALRAREPANDP